MLEFLKSSLSERNGKPSSTRIVSSLWVLGILFCIIFTVVKTSAFPVISSEMMLSVVGVLGVRAFQRGKEDAAKTPAQNPPQ